MKRLVFVFIVLSVVYGATGERLRRRPRSHGSTSEVRKLGVKLSVEQVEISNDIVIQISDHWAKNNSKSEVTCELWYVHGKDEHKYRDIQLEQTNGIYATRLTLMEFTHGTIAKIIFQPEWMQHRLTAWTLMYYH